MTEYPKIQTLFKRDTTKAGHPIIIGDYTLPIFEYLKNNDWLFTEKVDGTNIRIIITPGHIKFAGRTDTSTIPPELYASLMKKFLPDLGLALIDTFPQGVVLYGEGYGKSIQKGGGAYRSDQGFILLDVRVGAHWFSRPEVEEIGARFGIDVVPILTYGALDDMMRWTRTGMMSRLGDRMIEGVVARPPIDIYLGDGQRVITKLKHRDFHALRGAER